MRKKKHRRKNVSLKPHADGEKARKRKAGSTTQHEQIRRKKKSKGEAEGTPDGPSGNQPEPAAAAAATEVAADTEVDRALMQWGSKQKRKHARPTSAAASQGLPDQAQRASPQMLLTSYFHAGSPGCSPAVSPETAVATAPTPAVSTPLVSIPVVSTPDVSTPNVSTPVRSSPTAEPLGAGQRQSAAKEMNGSVDKSIGGELGALTTPMQVDWGGGGV